MNIHEYQGKEILKKFGVNVPEGYMADTPETALEAAGKIQKNTNADSWAVKAQIHAGGRGKGGGVKIARSLNEVKEFAGQIIGMRLITHQTGAEGKIVKKLLIEEGIYYPGTEDIKEFYLSILLDRAISQSVIVYSPRGGMDIEEVAANTPDLIFKEEINPIVGLMPFQTRRIAFNLGLSGDVFTEMQIFLTKLYDAYLNIDASLLEINPLFKTSDNRILAADCKIVIEDNAIFRHPDYKQLRDLNEEDPAEIEAAEYDLNFIKLNGNVGCMVNGAGLAMATMDIIKLSGADPANFLDVGGSANAARVEHGFRIILKDPNVKAILVNIFGGIVRCDRVAKGIVDAYNSIGSIKVPVIVRLQGTNAEEGKDIIDKSGLQVHSAISLQEAATLIKSFVKTEA